LTSLVLLSNELRDWEADSAQGILTLVVRLGYRRGRQLYLLLMMTSLTLPLLFMAQGLLERGWLVLLAAVLVPALLRLTSASREERVQLPKLTGRFMALGGGLYILASLPI
ncbi:MAG TPA: UbiA family prenyltransferase, partial [Motiliproteus sp.]